MFNRTNLSLFLHSFLLFLIAKATVQPIQVIIISSIYYLSSIGLWSFSNHLCTINCWLFCSNWSGQRSLILKLVLGWVSKLSVGLIQTGHMDFLPIQVFPRSWQGCQLGDQTCLLQFNAFLDLKYPSIYLFKSSFGIIFIGSAFINPETFPQVCYPSISGLYLNCTYIFDSFPSLFMFKMAIGA